MKFKDISSYKIDDVFTVKSFFESFFTFYFTFPYNQKNYEEVFYDENKNVMKLYSKENEELIFEEKKEKEETDDEKKYLCVNIYYENENSRMIEKVFSDKKNLIMISFFLVKIFKNLFNEYKTRLTDGVYQRYEEIIDEEEGEINQKNEFMLLFETDSEYEEKIKDVFGEYILEDQTLNEEQNDDEENDGEQNHEEINEENETEEEKENEETTEEKNEDESIETEETEESENEDEQENEEIIGEEDLSELGEKSEE